MNSKINLNSKIFPIIFFIFSFIFLSAVNFYKGFPKPIVTDDYSYLLAADTFANGRVTNPPHQYWEFFENAHILSTPTHMSKYQPGYGAVLALGKVVFGNTFYGVILATALFAACFFWLAKTVMPQSFAFFGAIFILIYFGIFTYWGRSYFGGASLSAFATCLVLGSYFHSIKLEKLSYPIQFFIGCAILFFTRPYEGGVFVIAILACILFDILKNKISLKNSKSFIILGFISTILIFSLQGFYNYKVTGDYKVMPYKEQIKQYMYARYFPFEEKAKPEHLPKNQILGKLYSQWEAIEFDKVRAMNFIENTKYSLSNVFNSSVLFSYFLISLVFCLFYLKPSELDKKLIFITCLCVFASAVIPWQANHYMFAIIVIMILFVNKTIYGLLTKAKDDVSIASFLKKYKVAIIIFNIICLIIGIYLTILVKNTIKQRDEESKNYFMNWTVDKQVIINEIESSTKLNLVFVRYKDYVKSGEEEIFNNPSLYDSTIGFVYNEKSDIDSNTTIFAHDLGDSENKKLIEYYKAKNESRAVWILDLTDIKQRYRILPYK